jgi:hypothetical protein
LIIGYSTSAIASNLGLDTFYTEGNVTSISATSATLEENTSSSTLLANDPYYGSYTGISTKNLISVSFDYIFTEPTGNDDSFLSQIYDLSDYYNPIYLIDIDYPDNGSIVWDFTGIYLSSVPTLGIEFQLTTYEDNADFLSSTVEITNWTITRNPVPEPSIILLFGVGLLGVANISRKKASS